MNKQFSIIIDGDKRLVQSKLKVINIDRNTTGKDLRRILTGGPKYKFEEIVESFVKESPEDAPSDIIKRGKKKIVKISYCDYKLEFSVKNIEDNEKLFELGILEGSHIHATLGSQIKGGISSEFSFADIRKENTIELSFSKTAPKYRKVCEGLNLFGKCSNENCETKGDEVAVPIGNDLDYDLGESKNECKIRCPIWKQVVKAITCGFYKCYYNFEGIKFETKKKKPIFEEFTSPARKAPTDSLRYYIPEKELGKWIELKIYVSSNEIMERDSTEANSRK